MRNRLKPLGRFFKVNWHLKILALLLAALTFYAIREKTSIEIPYNVPLEVRFDEKGIAILEQDVRTVKVTFRGSQEDLQRLEQKLLRAVVRPKVTSPAGTEAVPIGPGNIEGLSGGVRAVKVRPSSVGLKFDRETEIQVAVEKPAVIGTPLIGKVSIDYEPQHVTIRGPRMRLKGRNTVSTAPVDVDGRVESFTKEVRVLPPNDMLGARIEPSEITVTVHIVTESVSREWTNVTVRALTAPALSHGVTFDPPTVSVTVEGRVKLLESMPEDSIKVFVDCVGLEPSATYELPVNVHVPCGSDVNVSVTPETTKVTFVKPSS